MSLVRVRSDRSHRTAPVEFADAVELYFRNSGRHGRLVWIPSNATWAIKVTLRSDDPRMKAWQEGRLELEPFEQIELAEYNPHAITLADGRKIPGYVGYELEELGVSGLLEFLGRADVTTGRGEFGSLSEAVAYQRQRQKDEQEKARLQAQSAAKDAARDKRRSILKIPFLGVKVDLKTPANTPVKE